jgi:hypothetical protein
MGVEVRVHKARQGQPAVWKLFVPEARRRALWFSAHKGRHLGERKMMEGELRDWFWPGMRSDVQAYCDGCWCARAKDSRRAGSHSAGGVGDKAMFPMHILAVDLFEYGEHGWWLTSMDLYSSKVFARPVSSKAAAEIKRAWDEQKQHTGKPAIIISDRGTEFNLLSEEAIRWLAPAYRPQWNGQLERVHKEIASVCRTQRVDPGQAVHIINTPAVQAKFWEGWAGADAQGKAEALRLAAARAEAAEGKQAGGVEAEAGMDGDEQAPRAEVAAEGEAPAAGGDEKEHDDAIDPAAAAEAKGGAAEGKEAKGRERGARGMDDEAEALPRATHYEDADGRRMWRRYYEGDYVLRFRDRRSRAKSELAWSEPMLVAKVLPGKRRYQLRGRTRALIEADVDALKPVPMPSVEGGWRVSERVWEAVFHYDEADDSGWGVDKSKMVLLDGASESLVDVLRKSWKGQHVWLQGLYWRRREATAIKEKLDKDRPLTLTWALPDLQCERWFRQLDSKEYPSVWERVWADTGVEAEREEERAKTMVMKGIAAIPEEERMVDRAGAPVGRLAFAAWLCRVEPKRLPRGGRR